MGTMWDHFVISMWIICDHFGLSRTTILIGTIEKDYLRPLCSYLGDYLGPFGAN